MMTILFFGAAQGIVLSVVLLSLKRGHRHANRVLASVLILFSISMVLHTLSHSRFFFDIPHHQGFVALLFLPFGPLIYFYVRALTSAGYVSFGRRDWCHFLPFIVCTCLYIPFYWRSFRSPEPPVLQAVLPGIVFVHVVIYIVVVIKRLREHSRNIKASFSSIERINLNWLRALMGAVVVFWLAVIVLEGYGVGSEPWNIIWVLVSVFIYAIGYLGMRQPEIFAGVVQEGELPRKKYEKSTLTPGKAKEYLDELLEKMSLDKPFLRGDLSLAGLAKELAITPHELSQIINEYMNRNFFEFVNHYRVEEAKKMIGDPGSEHLKIAAIGFAVGFNSTSAFNAAFKKHTGFTPSQFKKKTFPGL